MKLRITVLLVAISVMLFGCGSDEIVSVKLVEAKKNDDVVVSSSKSDSIIETTQSSGYEEVTQSAGNPETTQSSKVKYPIMSDNICNANIDSGFVEIEGRIVCLGSKLEDVIQDSWTLSEGCTMDGFFNPEPSMSFQNVTANQLIFMQVRQGADSRLGNAIVYRIQSNDEEGKIVFPGGFYSGMSYYDVIAKLGQPNEEEKSKDKIWLTYISTKYTYRFCVYSNNAKVISIDYLMN